MPPQSLPEELSVLLSAAEAQLSSSVVQARVLAEEAQRRAVARGDMAAEGYSSYLLGRIELERGIPESAQAFLNHACHCAQQLGIPALEGRSRHVLGRLLRNQGRRLEALECLNQARLRCQEAGERAEEAYIISTSATIYYQLSEVREAISRMNEAVVIARQLNNPTILLSCLNNLGGMEVVLDQHEDGERHCKEVLALARQHGEIRFEVLAQGNLSYTYVSQGRYEEALEMANATVANAHAHHLNLPQITGQTSRGRALSALGRPREAERSLRAALFLARAAAQTEEQTEIFNHLGDFYLAQNRPGRAQLCFTRALALAQSNGALPFVAEAHRGLSQLAEVRGAFQQALEHYKAFHDAEQEHLRRQERSVNTALRVYLENERAQKAAREDALTGLLNRRSLDEYLQQRRKGSQESHVVIAFVDIDNFKRINDQHGHALGDDVLRQVAMLLCENCRPQDLIVRYGGEEFVLLLRGTDIETGQAICERIRTAVEQASWHKLTPQLRVTVSIGLASDSTKSVETLMQLADSHLYQAKNTGKNRVVA